MKRVTWHLRSVWYLSVVGFCVIGAFGYWWWTVRAAKIDYQAIAFITINTGSASALMRPISDAIELFSRTYKLPIKRYGSDGTPESCLHLLQQIYAKGIRKVVGPVTSQEFGVSVQQFIVEHPDMAIITPSATASRIGAKIKMPNFFRFVAADDSFISIYGQLLPARVNQLDQILVLARDDVWGKSLVELAQMKWAKAVPRVKIQVFFYKRPESFVDKNEFIKELAGVVQAMRAVLQQSNKHTAIVLFTFDELNDYVTLVYKDPLFKIPCFGGDSVAYTSTPLEDPLVAQFLTEIGFEALAYFGDNAFSSKDLTIAENLLAQQKKARLPFVMPSLYAFAAYDAMRCFSLCTVAGDVKKVLADFYGVTGYVEIDELGNRPTGSFMGVGLVANDVKSYRWVPLSLTRQEVTLTNYGVTERIVTDLAQKYTITWDKQLDVRVGTISLDLTSITELFKPSRNFLDAVITEYVIVQYLQHGILRHFIIFPALTKNGTQVYLNIDTRNSWTKKTSDNIYIAETADHPVVEERKPIMHV